MIIEALYPELCCLYGDMANIRYLAKCLPDAQIINTDFTDKPYFVDNDVDMVYIGSMSELTAEKVIQKLSPYKDRIKQLIANDVTILVTGNAMSVLGEKIITDGKESPALGLYPFYTKRTMNSRHNSMFYGEFEDIEIVGYKSQFDFYYGIENYDFIKVGAVVGNNPDDKFEGLRDHRLFATSLIGPFLVLNPLFTKKMLSYMGSSAPLAFESEVMEAYEYRLRELKQDGAQLIMH